MNIDEMLLCILSETIKVFSLLCLYFCMCVCVWVCENNNICRVSIEDNKEKLSLPLWSSLFNLYSLLACLLLHQWSHSSQSVKEGAELSICSLRGLILLFGWFKWGEWASAQDNNWPYKICVTSLAIVSELRDMKTLLNSPQRRPTFNNSTHSIF